MARGRYAGMMCEYSCLKSFWYRDLIDSRLECPSGHFIMNWLWVFGIERRTRIERRKITNQDTEVLIECSKFCIEPETLVGPRGIPTRISALRFLYLNIEDAN